MSQAVSLLHKANALLDAGQAGPAEAAIKRAIAADPRRPEGYAMMTHLLATQRKFVQAEYFAKQAADRAPGDANMLHNYGQMLYFQAKYDQAEVPLTRAVELNPGYLPTRAMLGLVNISQCKYASAARALRPGVEASPPDLDMTNSYTHALHCAGRAEQAIGPMRDIVRADPGHVGRVQHLASMVNYAPGISAEEVAGAHRAFGLAMRQSHGPGQQWDRGAYTAARQPGPLRVGLISPDLRDHAVGYLIEAFPEWADRSKVFIAGYSSAAREDARSAVIKKKLDLWRSVTGVATEEAAALIRQDRIDVLIDLAGHTSNHRLDVLALKPAPVQMTYMGYPNCTGLAAVDYRIVDTLSEPEGMEPFFVEKLLRMDPCFLSYRVPDTLPPVSDLPLARPGAAGPTFSAFSSLIKFNTPLFNLWARVLKELPGSTMILKHFGLMEAEVQQDVKMRFADAGVDPARVLAEAPEPSSQQVLPQYSRVDICLDTFPYNGTTTICESVLMGVPVVSLTGQTPASRVSRSLLAAIGTPELCATTEDEFVRIAVGLARDVDRLKRLRSELRGLFLRCPIGDGPRFARRFTDMAIAAYEGWAQGRTISRVVETPLPEGT